MELFVGKDVTIPDPSPGGVFVKLAPDMVAHGLIAEFKINPDAGAGQGCNGGMAGG
jgi:hypothetical protein